MKDIHEDAAVLAEGDEQPAPAAKAASASSGSSAAPAKPRGVAPRWP